MRQNFEIKSTVNLEAGITSSVCTELFLISKACVVYFVLSPGEGGGSDGSDGGSTPELPDGLYDINGNLLVTIDGNILIPKAE